MHNWFLKMYASSSDSSFVTPQSKPPVVTSSSFINRRETIQNNTTRKTPLLTKITQCEKVKLFGPKGEDGWKCLWCNSTWQSFNATKVLHHLAKVPTSGMMVSYIRFMFIFVFILHRNLFFKYIIVLLIHLFLIRYARVRSNPVNKKCITKCTLIMFRNREDQTNVSMT